MMTPTHRKADRASIREALLRAEHCAEAIVTHLNGVIETRQIYQLKQRARELHNLVQAERRRYPA